ncbi:MAG: hypothetical protein JO191_02965 [Mycobacteriaceae bacterium]|nr:hypothetical protein [Mycobacteriaceae bacterium]
MKLQLDLGLDPEADAVELDESTGRLQDELLELDVDDVRRASIGVPPPGARAADVTLLGTLLVTLGQQEIAAVVRVVGDWLARGARRTATLQIGDDVIELTNVSRANQTQLLNVFLARHAPAVNDG